MGGYDGDPKVVNDLPNQNVSAERLRLGPVAKFVVDQPALAAIRRNLVPQGVRDVVKSRFQLRKRPELTSEERACLVKIFDDDLAKLGEMLDIKLNCENFDLITSDHVHNWVR